MSKKKKLSYIAITKKDLHTELFKGLSLKAFKLFFYFYSKYRGIDEEIIFTYKMIKNLNGFKSTTTFVSAMKELESKGIIVKTKQGGLFHQANRYKLNKSAFIIF